MSSDAAEGENSEEEENEWMQKEPSKETSKHYEKRFKYFRGDNFFLKDHVLYLFKNTT